LIPSQFSHIPSFDSQSTIVKSANIQRLMKITRLSKVCSSSLAHERITFQQPRARTHHIPAASRTNASHSSSLAHERITPFERAVGKDKAVAIVVHGTSCYLSAIIHRYISYYIYAYVYVHICTIYICTYVHMYIYMHTHTHMFIYIHTHIHRHKSIQGHTRLIIKRAGL